jgi:hypothetical protein
VVPSSDESSIMLFQFETLAFISDLDIALDALYEIYSDVLIALVLEPGTPK